MKKIAFLVLFLLVLFTACSQTVVVKRTTQEVPQQEAKEVVQEPVQQEIKENSSVQSVSVSSEITLSADEVAKHNTRDDCWTIINGNILNLVTYMDAHPGGVGNIMLSCGIDSSSYYSQVGHSNYADSLFADYYVGKLNEVISSDVLQQRLSRIR
jgi:cytochrome b involved in lipid metabolism